MRSYQTIKYVEKLCSLSPQTHTPPPQKKKKKKHRFILVCIGGLQQSL